MWRWTIDVLQCRSSPDAVLLEVKNDDCDKGPPHARRLRRERTLSSLQTSLSLEMLLVAACFAVSRTNNGLNNGNVDKRMLSSCFHNYPKVRERFIINPLYSKTRF